MENYVELFTNNGNIALLFWLSFLGGVVASISPCSLAMIPLIVGYIGGYSNEKPARTLVQLIFFVLGTAIVFTAIGIICAITGKVFVSFAGGYFGLFAGGYFGLVLASLVLVMGLKLVGILDFDMPVIIKEMPRNEGTNTFLYPVILGAVFALAGTPCSTPILAAIMAFASLSASMAQSVVMLFLFALGQGIILIFAGVLTSKLKNWKGFYKFSDLLLKISGILLILAALYIFYKIFLPFVVK